MDVRPAGSSIPQTTALDALRRVQSSAAADEDPDGSQTAGYLFGDSKPKREGQTPNEDDDLGSDDPSRGPMDLVELSQESLLAVPGAAPISDGTALQEILQEPPSDNLPQERHVDIEA